MTRQRTMEAHFGKFQVRCISTVALFAFMTTGVMADAQAVFLCGETFMTVETSDESGFMYPGTTMTIRKADVSFAWHDRWEDGEMAVIQVSRHDGISPTGRMLLKDPSMFQRVVECLD